MTEIKGLGKGEIAEKFELTGATVSYHLSTLKKADMIREEKVKRVLRRNQINK